MEYIVKRLPDDVTPIQFNGEFTPETMPEAFKALNEAAISDYPWLEKYPDSFPAFARVGYNESGLIVLMYAKENPILKNITVISTRQCTDSCLEFFVKPFPENDDRYMNIEISASGVPYVGLGPGRGMGTKFKGLVNGMDVSASEHKGGWWAVSYRIPACFMKMIYGETLAAGSKMKANFYKCSENIHPHFGTWNHVESPKPDFHRPECFGDLTLE